MQTAVTIIVALIVLFVVIDKLMARYYWPDGKTAMEDFRDSLRALRRAVDHSPTTNIQEIKKSRVRSGTP